MGSGILEVIWPFVTQIDNSDYINNTCCGETSKGYRNKEYHSTKENLDDIVSQHSSKLSIFFMSIVKILSFMRWISTAIFDQHLICDLLH